MGFGFDNLISPHAYFPLPFSSAPLRFPFNNVHHPAFPPSHHKFLSPRKIRVDGILRWFWVLGSFTGGFLGVVG